MNRCSFYSLFSFWLTFALISTSGLHVSANGLQAGSHPNPEITECRDNPDGSEPVYDLLLLNARVLDGTGSPWFYSDLAIHDGRIRAMGVLEECRSHTRVDLGGRYYLSPGFIDVHSHAAQGLVQEELSRAHALLAQGITTVVINPDGGGPVDLAQQREDLLKHGLGVNVAQMVPHGAIRRDVIGEEDRPPQPEEMDRMKALVRDGMEEGAIGLSSGLFYAPASYADTDEIIHLANVVALYNGIHQSHIRDESDYSIGLVAAVDEIIEISRVSGIPGVVTHIKALGPNVWGASDSVVERFESARREGVEVYADQYPYHASATSLSAALVPRWATDGGRQAFLERLGDPTLRSRIYSDMEENLTRRGGADRISMRYVEDQPGLDGQTLQQIADQLNRSPVEAALSLLEEGSPGIVSFNMNDEDIRRFMQQSWTMTSSDGGLVEMGSGVPHPRNYGTFSRKIHRYVLQKEILDLPFAIRSMTSLSATVHRIPDRGLVRPGKVADLAIFHPDEIRDKATFTEPHQLSEGIHHLLVNGEFVIYQGSFTDRLPGQILNRPLQTCPNAQETDCKHSD